MKKTTKKLTLGMKIASILACLALVSVGFASWWIIQYPEESTTTAGSFEVYSVGTKKVTISEPVFTPTGDSTIIFGKQSKDAQNEDVKVKWLVAGEDVKEQNLDAQFTFDVSMKDVGDNGDETVSTEVLNKYLSTISFSLDDVLGQGNNAIDIAGAITAGYITAPKLTYSYTAKGQTTVLKSYEIDWNNNKFEFDIDTSAANVPEITVTVTVTFGWGETFDKDGTPDSNEADNLNPYVYYNSQNYSVEIASKAQSALEGLQKLSTTTYKVEITAVPGNSEPAN